VGARHRRERLGKAASLMSYVVEVRKNAAEVVAYHEASSFGKAKQLGKLRGLGYPLVEIVRRTGIKPGKPIRWRYFRGQQEWKPIATAPQEQSLF